MGLLQKMGLGGKKANRLVMRQLFDRESCTYTYILGDAQTREAVIIDPVDGQLVDRDTKLLKELGLNLKFALNSHLHADHVFGNYELKQHWPGLKSVLGKVGNEEAVADLFLEDGEILKVGSIGIKFLHTPGHTAGCHSFYVENGDDKMIFTGDAVLIRKSGRTDFQQGNSHQLYENVHGKILSLPKDTKIYPAHDYQGHTMSTVEEEQNYNERFTKSEKDFVDLMKNLNLPYPKKIDESLPLNMVDGKRD